MADLVDPRGDGTSDGDGVAVSSAPPTSVGDVTVYASRLKPEHATGLFHPNLDQIVAEGGSALRGFGNTATLGLLPVGIAGFNALRGQGSFRDNLSHEQSVDRADAAAHPIAHNIGEALGILLPLAVGGVGPILAGAKGLTILRAAAPALEVGADASTAAKIAEAGSGVGHLVRTGAASGTVGGVVGQGVSDTISGQGFDPANYAGAALGGGLGGGLHWAVGGTGAGMIAGGSTPTLQALLHGAKPNLQDAYTGALVGIAAGHPAEGAAATYADFLKSNGKNKFIPNSKGRLGERLSMFDAYLRGYGGLKGDVKTPLSTYDGRRGFTRVDVVGDRSGTPLRIESKFGPGAEVSDRQWQAKEELPGYEVQWWLPRDVGGMAGALAGGLFHQEDSSPYQP